MADKKNTETESFVITGRQISGIFFGLFLVSLWLPILALVLSDLSADDFQSTADWFFGLLIIGMLVTQVLLGLFSILIPLKLKTFSFDGKTISYRQWPLPAFHGKISDIKAIRTKQQGNYLLLAIETEGKELLISTNADMPWKKIRAIGALLSQNLDLTGIELEDNARIINTSNARKQKTKYVVSSRLLQREGMKINLRLYQDLGRNLRASVGVSLDETLKQLFERFIQEFELPETLLYSHDMMFKKEIMDLELKIKETKVKEFGTIRIVPKQS
jgi:hypothetical protein